MLLSVACWRGDNGEAMRDGESWKEKDCEKKKKREIEIDVGRKHPRTKTVNGLSLVRYEVVFACLGCVFRVSFLSAFFLRHGPERQ